MTGPDRLDLLDWSYAAILIGKAALGAGQLAAGLAIAISPDGAFRGLAAFLTRWELAEDPADPLASAVLAWASNQTAASETFYAYYLLGHGLLNFGVAVALFLRLPGAFWVSVVALAGFITYQAGRFLLAGDPALLILTAIDALVLTLALIERRRAPAA